MRTSIADVLAILAILTIGFGTATVIGHFRPDRPVIILGIVAGALVALLPAIRAGYHAEKTELIKCPIHHRTRWPACTYLATGLGTLLIAGLAIGRGLVFEVFLGMAGGCAVGATLTRHGKAPSLTQAEQTTDHTYGHG